MSFKDWALHKLAFYYTLRGLSLSRRQQYQLAEYYLNEAVRLEALNAHWYLELARVQHHVNSERARKTFATAISMGRPNALLECSALYALPGAIEYWPTHKLWHVDRLDIAAKFLFVRHHLQLSEENEIDIKDLYRRHIFLRTNGREPEAFSKRSVKDYERDFVVLVESMKANGFREDAAIPVDRNGRILGGAHRLATALALGLDTVPVVRIGAPWVGLDWGMAWFLKHGFKPPVLNRLLYCWVDIQYLRTALVVVNFTNSAFGREFIDKVKSHFPILAWRDICPDSGASMATGYVLPTGQVKLIWLNSQDHTRLASFIAAYKEIHLGHIGCSHLYTGSEVRLLKELLFDEDLIASWHLSTATLLAGASAIEQWTQYGE